MKICFVCSIQKLQNTLLQRSSSKNQMENVDESVENRLPQVSIPAGYKYKWFIKSFVVFKFTLCCVMLTGCIHSMIVNGLDVFSIVV